MALHVHRSERADALIGPLARQLSVAPADPFEQDVVAVPTRGVERWLAQRLSHHLGVGPEGEAGICANVVFPSPARLIADVLEEVAGLDEDPWDVERLVWPLLDTLDAAVHDRGYETVARYLGTGDPDDSHRRARRYSVARHVAGLFGSYAAQRPDLVVDWAGGGAADVPPDLAWQPDLWRRVRAAVGTPSPAERLADAVRRVREGASLRLPQRLNVFGPTRLPEDQLRVLAALADHRDVHLWLLHPSPALWNAATGPLGRGPSRRADRHTTTHHPLLASLARDATELQLRLTTLDVATDSHHPAPERPSTLLGRLQAQLRDDAPPTTTAVVAPDDRSVRVHACHGRARQVEVLREVLLQLFAADDSLEPRDVLVMCPDVETFAPLISATFGLAPEEDQDETTHPGHRLRVRLADRSLRQTNPMLSLLSQLLHLADGRVSASEVLDVVASAPVRRRFGLDDDDLDRLRQWTVAAGTRWGENASRRARFDLDHIGQGTWESALDRILLGAAMADEGERWVGTALPLDDVDSVDIDLAGRLAELVDRLTLVLRDLSGERPLQAWLTALDRSLDLLTDTTPTDAWQTVQARRVLGDVRAAEQVGTGRDLRLPDVRALLARKLEGRPTRANFRTGNLTMCSLVPMRSVPHRVVALLGMDDGAFPRGAARDGDDVLLRDPRVGERDRRSEDRQLFLDAVLAAGDHLLVLHSGADERTGAAQAPAVPVGEVLDALDRTATLADGRPVREHVVVRHPLQPFDSRNFTAGALGTPGPASFDVAALAGAQAARSPRDVVLPFLPGPLPAAETEPELALDDLVRFLEHPAKELLRRRLGVAIPFDDDDVSDRLSLELDALESWGVGERLLDARLAGADGRRSELAEWRRGVVPPRALGTAVMRDLVPRVDVLVTTVEAAVARRPSTAADVLVDLPEGRVLSGTLAVHGETLVRGTYSKLGPKHRLRAWVQVLALSASHPGTSWTAVTIGRGPSSQATARQSVITAPAAGVSRSLLLQLVDLRDRGMREPLPMPVKTLHSYARTRMGGASVEQALDEAGKDWAPGRFDGEREDGYHEIVWGTGASLRSLLGPAPADEQAWATDEPSRLGVLAQRLWLPLFRHEQLGSA